MGILSQVVCADARPSLQAVAHAEHLVERDEPAAHPLPLAHADGRALSAEEIDHPEMHGIERIRLVVDEADEPRRGPRWIAHLLVELAEHGCLEDAFPCRGCAICLVHVAAYPY